MSQTVTISAIIIASIFISLVVGQTCPAGTNLIQNPSFETPAVASGTSSQLPLDGITNWTGVSVNGNCPTPGTVELVNGLYGPASDGSQYVELDAQCNTAIIQRFQTVPGQLYVLAYDYSPTPGVDAASNVANVYFNGERINSVTNNGVGLTSTNFTTFTQLVTGAGPDELVFEGLGTPDGLGGLIDNVYLCPLVCQPPPPCYTLTMDPMVGCNYTPSADGTPCSSSCSLYVCQMGVCVPPPVPCDQPQDHHYYPGYHYEHKEYKYQQSYGHHEGHYGYGYQYTQYPVPGYKPPSQPQYQPHYQPHYQPEYEPKHYGDDDDYKHKEHKHKEYEYESEEDEYKPKEHKHKEYEYKSEEDEYKPKEYKPKHKEYEYKSEEDEYKPKEYKPKHKEYESEEDEYKPKEYKPKHKEYESEEDEYKPKHKEYESEEDEYKPKEYKPKHKEYESEEDEYKPKEYKPKHKDYEYKSEEDEYKPKEYKPKHHGYQPEEEEYEPKEYKYESPDYEYKPKDDDYEPDFDFDEYFKADNHKYSSGSGRRSHH